MKKRILFLALLALTLMIMAGCMLTVDEMYRLPKRSEAYNNLQSAIDLAMFGLSYSAPLAGENRQTVQMTDLDGDGVQEYLLFAKGTEDRPLRILVFRNVDGEFVNTETVESNGSAFDQVEYVDMDGNGGMEIVVGRQLSDQVLRSVSVYTFTEDALVQQVSVNYTKFLTTDLDGDNTTELFVLRPGTAETGTGVAELYSMKGGSIERYNEAAMSLPAENLKRIVTGKLDGGTTAVFVACAVGDNALQTDIYTIVDKSLVNVAAANQSSTGVQTLRNYFVYADDIDNDGVVELPSLITMKPVNEISSSDTHQLIRWYAMTPAGDEVDKMYTYHNFVGGWYMQLDREWAPRLVVQNLGYVYEFYLWDASYKSAQKLVTVYAFTTQNRETLATSDGKFVLYKTDSTVYSAFLEEGAKDLGLTQETISYSFRMIQKDWKTGET